MGNLIGLLKYYQNKQMKKLNEKIKFSCGKSMINRFALAPMTNKQSYDDGTLSNDEYHWLTMRSKGQFGMTMTCASHVSENGKGFERQLGIFDDKHNEGHIKLAKGIKSFDSLAIVQLHHAGMRSPKDLIKGKPVCPSDNEETGARALSLKEVKQLEDDFIKAGLRAKKCGYDGVEIHGAHGYILCQFFSSEINKREDNYGGSLENRYRILFNIIKGIREVCGKEFMIGVRLSPERFGIKLNETKTICKQLIDEGNIDFLDISLWDSFKLPIEEEHNNKTLLQHFTEINYKNILLTVAGNINTSKNVNDIVNAGVDFVSIGKAAILHHDFPLKVINNSEFEPIKLPVSRKHLEKEGLGKKFIDYLSKWPDFISD